MIIYVDSCLIMSNVVIRDIIHNKRYFKYKIGCMKLIIACVIIRKIEVKTFSVGRVVVYILEDGHIQNLSRRELL